jgi:hypothetical protein
MRSAVAVSIVVLLSAPAAFAQERGTVALRPQSVAEKQVVEIAARVPFETPLKGAPYSADIVVESTQTLADGNHISNRSVGHVARDSEGRTRREQEGALSVVTRTEPIITTKRTTISIVDPVAGYSYSLNPEQKIAYRTPLATSKELLDKVQAGVLAAQRTSQPMTEDQKKQLAEKVAQAKAEGEKVSAEQAGREMAAEKEANAVMRARGGGMVAYAYTPNAPPEHATIDGLAVEGHKTSETIPAGQIGNEQPITITSEEWRSPDLKVLVLTKHNDPRSGESTYRLANVLRGEPDPSLFMVPPDYTVKDTGIRRNE